MRPRFAIAAAILLAALPLRADLSQAKAEPNLEKRSKLALDNALAAVKQGREAYQKGDMDDLKNHLADALASVELCDSSLKQTGKDPRRSPKWFKRAELELRDLIRRIDAAQQEMSYVDRPLIENLRTRTQQVHDSLLTGLMEGRKK